MHNRNLYISGLFAIQKVDIETPKVDIGASKVDIEKILKKNNADFSLKTTIHIYRLFKNFGTEKPFGRNAVMNLLNLKSSSASKLLANLRKYEIIEPVQGLGKGKYKFKN